MVLVTLPKEGVNISPDETFKVGAEISSSNDNNKSRLLFGAVSFAFLTIVDFFAGGFCSSSDEHVQTSKPRAEIINQQDWHSME